MPSVWLSLEDCRKGNLPGFCLACGRRTESRVEHDFRGSHVGVNPFSVFDPPLMLRVPMCEEHCQYWRDRFREAVSVSVASLLSLLMVGAGACGVFWLQACLSSSLFPRFLWVVCCVLVPLTMLYSLKAADVRAFTTQDHRIRLENVSSEFCCAYKVLRETTSLDLDRAASQTWNAPKPAEQVPQDPPRPWCDAHRVRDEDELDSSREHQVLSNGPRE
jgi:hypothetical protein